MSLSQRTGHVHAQAAFIQAALLAAHVASGGADGFRPSDVRFFFLLFTNWLEHDVLRSEQDLDLTQVTRVLRKIEAEGGVVRGKGARRGPRANRYALTQDGLISLVEALVDTRAQRRFDEALFIICFAALYRTVIAARVKGGTHPLASSARRRAEGLLDPRRVLRAARQTLTSVLADLTARMEEARELDETARAALADDTPLPEIAARLEQLSPYRLHRVRPFAELVMSLPDDLLRFELSEGIRLRTTLLFEPLAAKLRGEIALLDALDERLVAMAAEAIAKTSPR